MKWQVYETVFEFGVGSHGSNSARRIAWVGGVIPNLCGPPEDTAQVYVIQVLQ